MSRLLTIAVLVCASQLATAGIRCGNMIIDKGTTSAEVTALCGEPVQVDRHSSYTGSAAGTGGQPGVVSGSAVEIQVEIWTYNFGPNMLMQRIRFEDGIVVDIQSLGYGYDAP